MNPNLKAALYCLGIVILSWVIWLSSGCGDSSDKPIYFHIPANSKSMTTQEGYKCQMPRMYSLWGRDWVIFNETHIYDVVMNWLDIRIETTILAHPDKVKGRDIAKSIHYILFDDYMFPCDSDTGMCYGRTDAKSFIQGVIYARWKGNEYPDFQTNPDLVRTKEQIYYWTRVKGWLTQGSNYYASDMYPDGMGLLVIPHELEHCFYGEKYGHKGIKSQSINDVHMTVVEF